MSEPVKHTPDRIWVERDDETNEKRWFSIQGMGVEYVRADIADEMIEALRNLSENIEHAFPSMANLGPLVAARAAIAKAEGRS